MQNAKGAMVEAPFVFAGRPGGRAGVRPLGRVGLRSLVAETASPATAVSTAGRPGRPFRQAACGRYACHADGIVGLATWMKISARGARGPRRGCMPAWRGRRSPLRRLQGAQEATMFSQLELPPLERG